MAVLRMVIEAQTTEEMEALIKAQKETGFLNHGDLITNTEHDGTESYMQHMEKVVGTN